MKQFTISVSRMARGKAGYQQNKYNFGWSFYPETHTIESLITLAAVEGYSFLAGEFDRKPPADYDRTGVTTPRITENFRQTCVIPLDDDGKAGNAVAFWENDPLFNLYGGGYYHSTNSTPDHPRIRPIFELDAPITDPKFYQTARYALGWHYNRLTPRIDVLPQVPQVWYGSALPTRHKIFGSVLPLEVLERLVITPYLKVQAARRLIDQQQTRRDPTPHSIAGLIDWLARQKHNRHNSLVSLGYKAKDAGVQWDDVSGAVIAACRENGYLEAYAKNDHAIERVFLDGWSRA